MQPIENAIEGVMEVTETIVQVQTVSASQLWILSIALPLLLIMLIAVLAKVTRISKRLEGAGQPAATGYVSAPQFAGIDPAVVAAISAAIAAYAPSGKQLVVRSVRRSSAWSDAGKRESLNY